MEWIANNALFLFVIIVSVIVLILIALRANKRSDRLQSRDIRKDLQPNSTNYNMATFDRADLERMSVIELKALLKKCEEGELTSLSPRDFHYIKSRLAEKS